VRGDAAIWSERGSIEERDVIGAVRRMADHFVDLQSVGSHENAPAIGLDTVERLGRNDGYLPDLAILASRDHDWNGVRS
jgi:hypothetical protein